MNISIAMATYNGAGYLNAQLQSFANQTRRPDELIVSDDGSTDETESVVRDFAKNAPFKVKFYSNDTNLGYCGNFNQALMKTTGDLVFLSDQDDVWFPEKIEHLASVIERNPEALIVMNDAALTDGELNEVGLTKLGQIRAAGFNLQDFVMGCCCALRRELLNMCMPIPKGVSAHDNWLVGFADGLDAKVVVEVVLQYYRRHEENKSQFIANRTARVNRAQVFFHAAARKLSDGGALDRESNEIEQLRLFARGVRDAKKGASLGYQSKLSKLLAVTEAKKEVYIKRKKLREKWLVPRLILILRLLASGGYKETSGIKAVLRDFVG